MAKKQKKKPQTTWEKIWHFIWHDDSAASWAVNIILAFIIIKFLVYPGLGALLGTSLPVVAVVSESMDHDYVKDQCNPRWVLCGDVITDKGAGQEFWGACGEWYEDNGISAEDFLSYPMNKGFSKGDIIVLRGKDPADIDVGDIVVFSAQKPYPIIHRVVHKELTENGYVFETKGDHNQMQIVERGLNEKNVHEDLVIGTAAARIPWLGWVKIAAVDLLRGNNRC